MHQKVAKVTIVGYIISDMIINHERKQQTQSFIILNTEEKTNVEYGRFRPLAFVLRSWRDLRRLNSLKLSSRPHDAQTASAQADIPKSIKR